MPSTSTSSSGATSTSATPSPCKHTVSGLLKLLYPSEDYDKEAVRRCLEYALEARRRVKEQLKKIGGMEFYDVHFSYIDPETGNERFIGVPEQGGGR
jgi:ATP-dependent Lon protease